MLHLLIGTSVNNALESSFPTPNLPQWQVVQKVSDKLKRYGDVVALWIGGSLARGAGDEYSDVDYRVAVESRDFSRWLTPDFSDIFPVHTAGVSTHRFGDDGVLHHMLLADGEQVDLFVQTTEREITVEPTIILACRCPEMRSRIEAASQAHLPSSYPSIDAKSIKQLVIRSWIDMTKAYKILHRGLSSILLTGQQVERMSLLRLQFILSTGQDCGDLISTGTIHAWSNILKASSLDSFTLLQLYGLPIRTREEVVSMLIAHRDELMRLGRQLSERFGFDYPETLEAAALLKHERFLKEWRR